MTARKTDGNIETDETVQEVDQEGTYGINEGEVIQHSAMQEKI